MRAGFIIKFADQSGGLYTRGPIFKGAYTRGITIATWDCITLFQPTFFLHSVFGPFFGSSAPITSTSKTHSTRWHVRSIIVTVICHTEVILNTSFISFLTKNIIRSNYLCNMSQERYAERYSIIVRLLSVLHCLAFLVWYLGIIERMRTVFSSLTLHLVVSKQQINNNRSISRKDYKIMRMGA